MLNFAFLKLVDILLVDILLNLFGVWIFSQNIPLEIQVIAA